MKAASPNAFIVLPPQLPEPPEAALMSQVAAPAPVISWKSALAMEIEAAVIVLGVPTVFDWTRTRLVAVAPADTVNRLETVIGPLSTNTPVLLGAG